MLWLYAFFGAVILIVTRIFAVPVVLHAQISWDGPFAAALFFMVLGFGLSTFLMGLALRDYLRAQVPRARPSRSRSKRAPHDRNED